MTPALQEFTLQEGRQTIAIQCEGPMVKGCTDGPGNTGGTTGSAQGTANT